MSKQSDKHLDPRTQIILGACDRFARQQLLEELADEVKAIESKLPKLGKDGARLRSLLQQLDAIPKPTTDQP